LRPVLRYVCREILGERSEQNPVVLGGKHLIGEAARAVHRDHELSGIHALRAPL
jgi:hypothetical protein